jgi:hypothetical protein
MHAVLALIIALSPIPHGHHYGWQQLRNPHHRPAVIVTRPPATSTGCTWVILNQVGSPPRLVCTK